MESDHPGCTIELDSQNTRFVNINDETTETNMNVDIVTVIVNILILTPFIFITSYACTKIDKMHKI